MRKIATHKFNIFTSKNVTWRTYLISFTVQCCFLFRFVSIELVSLIWVPQIWVAIYIYGTIIFNKEINANVSKRISSLSLGVFYCSFELHLTPHMTLSVETCIRHPVLSGHYSGCPLIQVSLYVPSPLLAVQTSDHKILHCIIAYQTVENMPTLKRLSCILHAFAKGYQGYKSNFGFHFPTSKSSKSRMKNPFLDSPKGTHP